MRLRDGQTSISVRRHEAAGADTEPTFQLWLGLEGNVALHHSPSGRFSIDGRWHLTIINTQLRRRPGAGTLASITRVADRLLENLGDVRIAGYRPRRDHAEFPRLYFVHVGSAAHQRLSSATSSTEQFLAVPHWRFRDCYHVSQDQLEAAWEHVDDV